MWNIFLQSLITVLVIYAVVNIVGKAIVALFKLEPYHSKDTFIVVRVKNQEKNIEGILRSIIWQNLKLTQGGFVPNILIVDMGSDDRTDFIAQKLAEQYSFVFYTTEDRFNKMKNAFEK